MISGMAGFLIAVGAVSAGCFVLMTRAENRRLGRARARSGASYVGGSTFDTDSSSVANWFGFSSSSGDAADSGSCTSGSWDSGSSDSGGGDCGGGGDGGGGGGD
jgi:hypothetical protein